MFSWYGFQNFLYTFHYYGGFKYLRCNQTFNFPPSCICIHKFADFSFSSASFCVTFMSLGIASSISMHVFSFLYLIIVSVLFAFCLHFSVCTARSHDTVTSSWWHTGLCVCVCTIFLSFLCLVLCILNCILCIAHWYLKEYCFFWRFQASSACVPDKIKMSVEHWCNIERGEPKNWDEKRSQCHFVLHKCYWTGPRSNPGFQCERLAASRLIPCLACVTFQLYKKYFKIRLLPSREHTTSRLLKHVSENSRCWEPNELESYVKAGCPENYCFVKGETQSSWIVECKVCLCGCSGTP